MALEEITYYIDGKKKTIKAKILKMTLEKGIGLMFQKNSPPLLFPCKRYQWLPITSLFCKPFKAIWLDEKMHATRVIQVKKWKFNISGYGKFLLEIPLNAK